MDKGGNHRERDEADGQVDIEIPAPVPVVGDPSAQSEANDGSDRQGGRWSALPTTF